MGAPNKQVLWLICVSLCERQGVSRFLERTPPAANALPLTSFVECWLDRIISSDLLNRPAGFLLNQGRESRQKLAQGA